LTCTRSSFGTAYEQDEGERKVTLTAVEKLRMVGPKLGPPHMKPLKGEGGLFELRPRQGRSRVRVIYRRLGNEFMILAVAVESDKGDFDAAVAKARERSSRYDG
jgi:hypothetical protein